MECEKLRVFFGSARRGKGFHEMAKRASFLIMSIFPAMITCEKFTLREDHLGHDPRLQIVHLFYGQFPACIAVSASGRKFTCYPAGFDATNTNNGSNGAIQVAEFDSFVTERAYPNASINNPPGGSIDFTRPLPRTRGLSNYFLGVQAIVIDFRDILWILDTGRVSYKGVQLDSSPGGPKLVSIDLETDTIIRIYTFPVSVAKPISYFSDVRFDTKREYAYIGDASLEGENAIVVLNLITGESWRVLERDFSVTAFPKFVPFIYGEPVYSIKRSSTGEITGVGSITIGVGGLALSPNADILYYSPAGRYLFSVPTSVLRSRGIPDPVRAARVKNLGEKGFSAAIVSNNLGFVFGGVFEQSGIFIYNPKTGLVVLFVRDSYINFISRFSIAVDGYMYFTVDQLNFLPSMYSGRGELGKDRREKPYVVFRIKLPGNSTKGPGS